MSAIDLTGEGPAKRPRLKVTLGGVPIASFSEPARDINNQVLGKRASVNDAPEPSPPNPPPTIKIKLKTSHSNPALSKPMDGASQKPANPPVQPQPVPAVAPSQGQRQRPERTRKRRNKYAEDHYIPEDDDLDEAYVSDEDMVASEDEELEGDDNNGARRRSGRHASKRSSGGSGRKGSKQQFIDDEYGEFDDPIEEKNNDFSELLLKQDHINRPLWLTPDGRIFLETYSPIYRQAYDFLIAISEPVCRPEFVHEYQLTTHSLYAAVSVGLETETIISVLNRLSKVAIPDKMRDFIRASTENYGKVKLVLKRNHFYVESQQPEILTRLLRDPIIADARVGESGPNGGAFVVFKALKEHAAADLASVQEVDLANAKAQQEEAAAAEAADAAAGTEAPTAPPVVGAEREEDPEREVLAFEINPEKVEKVKERCLPDNLNYPMLEEYDFKHDTHNADLPMELKPGVKLRPYQEKSLSKMFGNGRARSGIIVLPCGAGKSLVGVAAASRVKKSCLCLCTSSVSVDQWRHQFLLWTNLQPHQVSRFTADQKEPFSGLAGITVTTFTMVAFSGKRSEESERVMAEIRSKEWGLLLLDEVHVVPAQMFRRVIGIVKSHCKLGLTATLVREDEKIGDLNFLIGPKLYEANWLDLTRGGHIANVQCAEVWCPMTKEFFREYLKAPTHRKPLLYVMNPNKFMACQFLIDFHERVRGDKVIVFSDNIFALKEYAMALRKPFIYGPTSHAERTRVLHAFKHDPNFNTVFLSKVGDNSLDIPEANVLIQISSHAGSRRQEAQRLGRILRAKRNKPGGGDHTEFNAFFYTLVSKDTQEMYFSAKRQQFLIDQGYSFKVVTNLVESALQADSNLLYRTQDQQLNLLAKIMAASEEEAGVEALPEDADDLVKAGPVRRTAGSMAALTGASGMSYLEFKSGSGAGAGRRGKRPTFQGEHAKKYHQVLVKKK